MGQKKRFTAYCRPPGRDDDIKENRGLCTEHRDQDDHSLCFFYRKLEKALTGSRVFNVFAGRIPEKELPSLMEKNILIRIMGELAQLPEGTQKAINTALEATQKNTGMILNFAFNYGGRMEIISAVKKLCAEVCQGRLKMEKITEELFAEHLYSRGMPDPDLLIRPSGELRISNFLLWQLAYTELWFTKVLWPDFQREHFLQAILDYQIRERRFGSIKL